MNKESLHLLKLLSKEREITLSQAGSLLACSFNDYRDYFPLAALCTLGLAKTDVGPPDIITDKFLASYFYAHTLGIGTHQVNNYTTTNRSECSKKISIHITALGDSYISDKKIALREKYVAFLLGIISTVIALWVKSKWF
ncbi:MAG: hypothetical protein HRT92_06275 [Piscirickettsiaceae bacterium]|nr:hypothetical protein [Piscirickettsiaceae bacterium]